MKGAVIVNPKVAGERVERLESLMTPGADFDWLETTADDPGTGQARQAMEDGAEFVVVCGGDGTVRACAEALVGSKLPMGIVPLGTGNLLARNLGLPGDIERAVRVALGPRTLAIDTAEAGNETFVVMSGSGRDVDIMEDTGSKAKQRLGFLAYVAEAFAHLTDDPIEAHIEADGVPIADGEWALVLVGNVSKLQGGVEVFPGLTPSDGWLHLLALEGGSAGQTIAAGIEAILDAGSERLTRSRARHLTVAFSSPTKYEVDGDPRPPVEKLEVRVRPSSLNVRVSETPG